MTLHLAFSLQGLTACLQRRRPDEPLVLMGDAVYENSTIENGYRLVTDLEQRGLPLSGDTVDYTDLVQMTVTHSPVISWHS
ncbi:MAG: hypothetical protein AAF529_02730 [Pseudomonadota bacterium]